MCWSEAIARQAMKSYAIDLAHTNDSHAIDRARSYRLEIICVCGRYKVWLHRHESESENILTGKTPTIWVYTNTVTIRLNVFGIHTRTLFLLDVCFCALSYRISILFLILNLLLKKKKIWVPLVNPGIFLSYSFSGCQ